MKKLLKRIRSIWCRHDDYVFEVKYDIIRKYKNTKKGYKLRYDLWEKRYCPDCGKLIDKHKLKSDLTEIQMKQYIDIL